MEHLGHGADDDLDVVRPAAIRSFTLTGGRAVPSIELGFEAVVSTCTQARHRQWAPGPKAEILSVGDGLSIAEISAQLKLPIGVVRVLVADLVSEGHLEIQRTITSRTSLDERRELLERTLRGLRTTG